MTLEVLSTRRSFWKVLLMSLFVVQAVVSPLTVVQAADTATPVVTTTTSAQITSSDIIFDDMPAVEEETVQEVLPPARPTAIKTYTMDMTAYTSTVEECDADPFTTADGSTVRDGIIATNILPFGTKVRFPDVFGDRVFEVHDRMNARYSYRADVWMNDQKAMRQFGIKRNMKMEVIEMGKPKQTTWARKAQELALRQAAK